MTTDQSGISGTFVRHVLGGRSGVYRHVDGEWERIGTLEHTDRQLIFSPLLCNTNERSNGMSEAGVRGPSPWSVDFDEVHEWRPGPVTGNVLRSFFDDLPTPTPTPTPTYDFPSACPGLSTDAYHWTPAVGDAEIAEWENILGRRS